MVLSKMAIGDLPSPKAMIYDWDNTLVDNWAAIHHALNTTLSAMGQEEWSFQETLQRVRASMRDSFPKLFGDRVEEARDIFYSTFESHHIQSLNVLEGAHDVLDMGLQANLYQAVVSNKRGDFLRKECAHLGWTHFFGALIGANDAPKDKPDSAPILQALQPASLKPGKDIWYIGDSPIDIECARNAGCTAILVWEHIDLSQELQTSPPDYHFSDLRNLIGAAFS